MRPTLRTVAVAAAWPVGALLVSVFAPSTYVLHVLVMSGIYVILALSFNLVFGFGGLLSLATPAFFGIGAYASTLLTMHFGLDSFASLTLAVAISCLAAMMIGVPSLRMSSHSFVIVTLSFALLAQMVAFHWVSLTRGAMGISSIPALDFLGLTWTDKKTWLHAVLIADGLAFLVYLRIVASRVGRATVATRDNEELARAAGLNVWRVKMFTFAVSGAFAGFAGAWYAHYISVIDPGVFGFAFTENVLVMVVLGGSGTLLGPLWGAIAFTVAPELLRFSPEARSLLYGVLLLVGVLVFPQGLGRLRLPSMARRRKP
ncbi:MAG: branched-chain amino acid ABC transporter permease [Rhodospirillales bacterium]|jgi:branched-chain amino acid transport system permease protein|nr:branched-chain amino acid ABC transporter permease [Rhodospirillales bacterium]